MCIFFYFKYEALHYIHHGTIHPQTNTKLDGYGIETSIPTAKYSKLISDLTEFQEHANM